MDYKAINATTYGGQHVGLKETPVASNASGTSTGLYNGNIATWASLNPKINAATWTQQFTYDQLNRITGGTTPGAATSYRSTYSYDANGNIKTLTRHDKDGVLFDQFAYNYESKGAGYLSNTNKLRSVDDAVTNTTLHGDDLEDQMLDNYSYDDIGNLNKDIQEDIKKIEWTVYGKVKAVARNTGSSKPDLFFAYDATGNRVSKTSIKGGDITKTYYLRDASGNVMSTYTSENQTSLGLDEQYLYGSSRLGVLERGSRSYELADHLGNVRAVVTDQATVSSATDYYPFGMAANAYTPNGYRYGFNGYEKEEGLLGIYTTQYRQYDSRIGRWAAIDPLNQFVSSQYSAFINNPVNKTDPNGAWVPEVKNEDKKDDNGNVVKNDNGDSKKVGYLVVKMEKDDDEKSLAKMLNVTEKEAKTLLDDMNGKKQDYVKVPDAIAKPINEAIQDALDNPSNYNGWFDKNYNCWASAIYTSQGRFPLENNAPSNYNYEQGLVFTQRLLKPDYVNVSENPSEIKFGKTLIRIAQDKKDIFGYSYNVTTHGAIYLGKSRDGTEYVWTKNGWSDSPKVATLNATLQLYESKVQGAGEKVNEGGYYNYEPE